MTISLWLSLLGASTLISFTPGAGAINTMTNALSVGFRRSVWGILGQQLALLIHVVIVAAGVGLLVSGSDLLFNFIRYAGAAYLVYLGARMLLAKPVEDTSSGTPAAASGRTRTAMVRQGLLVNLLNPKAIVFFLAFTPQFIRPDGPLAEQYLVFIATIIAVDVSVMWFFFAAGARSARKFTQTARGQRIMNLAFGTMFIFVAALLAFLH